MEANENVQDIYELTPMQHGLLFDSVTGGDTGMYLIQLETFLSGALSVPDLERAWDLAIQRHPILRTSFHWEGMPKPLQVVQADAPITLPNSELVSPRSWRIGPTSGASDTTVNPKQAYRNAMLASITQRRGCDDAAASALVWSSVMAGRIGN